MEVTTMKSVSRDNLKELVKLANELDIKREDIVGIYKEGGGEYKYFTMLYYTRVYYDGTEK